MSGCAECAVGGCGCAARETCAGPCLGEPPAPSGILNIDKQAGMTSHDVVNVVRRVTGIRRVGHAGTLDPMATGVLLVCVGEATRVSEYLMRGRKVYRAVVLFGVSTDTQDMDGEIVSQPGADGVKGTDVEAALTCFVGTISQRPPAYSAIKREGTPAYKLARRGVSVELEPREVTLYRAGLVAWLHPVATIEVECSSGTYIRALARDLGEALGCGATLRRLTRLASGRFTLGASVDLDELEPEGIWREHLHAIDEALLDMPAIVVRESEAASLRQGQALAAAPALGGTLARVYTISGEFLAVAQFDASSGCWHPHKVFGVQ